MDVLELGDWELGIGNWELVVGLAFSLAVGVFFRFFKAKVAGVF
jgi:hypothetical protein